MKGIISSFGFLRFVKKNYLVPKKTSVEARAVSFISCFGQAFKELAGIMEAGCKLRELSAKNYHHLSSRVKNIQLNNKGLGLPSLKSRGSERGFILVTASQSVQGKPSVVARAGMGALAMV